MTSDNTICRWCGADYSDPNGVADDDYMWAGHILNDCDSVPTAVYDYVNGPPMERDYDHFPAVIADVADGEI